MPLALQTSPTMSEKEYGVWITDAAGKRQLWNKKSVVGGKGTHLGSIDGVSSF